ncbi:MAG: hypothetical protein AAF480_12000 [Actinomycetota bacterium]
MSDDNRQAEDDAAWWTWRQNSAAHLIRRMAEDNLQQLDTAVGRMSKNAYGVEDWLDDVRSAWSRNTSDIVDIARILWGLPATPDDIPVIQATLHTDSQSSGPIVFNVDVVHDSHLFASHVHRIVDGEVGRKKHLQPHNFEFEPADLRKDDPPRRIVMRLAGLNQHDEHGDVDKESRLTDGRYIGFVGAESDHDTHLAAVIVIDVTAPSLPDLDMT